MLLSQWYTMCAVLAKEESLREESASAKNGRLVVSAILCHPHNHSWIPSLFEAG